MRIFTQGAIHFLACPALLQHIIARASRAQKIATNLEAIGAHGSTALLLLLDELPGGVGGGDGLRGPDDWRVADGGGGESGNDGLLDCGGDHGCGISRHRILAHNHATGEFTVILRIAPVHLQLCLDVWILGVNELAQVAAVALSLEEIVTRGDFAVFNQNIGARVGIFARFSVTLAPLMLAADFDLEPFVIVRAFDSCGLRLIEQVDCWIARSSEGVLVF